MKKILLKEYKDDRGSLAENTSPKIFYQAKHFFVSKSKPGVIRGNHYHKRKLEWFYVLEGRAKLYLYDLKTKKRTSCIITSQKPELIEIMPNIAHAIKNIGRNKMILLAIINKKFDPKRPDTFRYDLI